MTEFDGKVDSERTITVEFIASVNADAPWEFAPNVSKMQIHPGEFYHTSYIARNLSNYELTGQAVPSIAPAEGSLYFKKIECFCFSQQYFKPGESKDMPVVFRIDPKISEEIATVTLSYTFFRVNNPDS
jgi:cytochrome c oxidase assembly protein subunit 11